MNKLKKSISIFLVLIIFVTAFSSCNAENVPSVTDTTAENNTEVETEAPPVDITVMDGKNTEYTIVIDDDASGDELEPVTALRQLIFEKFGFLSPFKTDIVRNESDIPETGKEILVGSTNRKESKNLIKTLRKDDFVVKYDKETERIIIMGGNAESTKKAIQYFIDNCIDIETKKITVKSNLNYEYKATYNVDKISINGTPLTDYVVVVPYKAEKYIEYAADNFVSWIRDYTGYELQIVDDKEAEIECEFLIGATNRKASSDALSVTMDDKSFLLKADGKKVVMLGNKYMIGGACSEFANNYVAKAEKGKDIDINNLPTANATKVFEFKEAKSAILMIGDGMGYNHINFAVASGKIKSFAANDLPNKGSCSTYSQSVAEGRAEYTDSAASATALSTANKTYNGYIGMNMRLKSIQNIREYASLKGAKTAVLTTDVITGATPAAFLAHTNSRNNTDVIQSQINELINSGKIDYCMGSVDSGLTKEAAKALNKISSDDSSFFMMIEEGIIDKRAHSNLAEDVKSMVSRYNDVITYVIEFVMMHPDTVLVITADHETGGLIPDGNGSYKFTSKNHTNTDVPVFAIGHGTEYFNSTITNTDIPVFLAKIYGAENFGQ